MNLFLIICSIFSGIVLILFIIAFAVFKVVFYNPPKTDQNNPKPDPFLGEDFPQVIKMVKDGKERLIKRPHETVSVTTDDGFRLYGDFYINPTPTKNTVLCVHGYNSSGYGDFGLIANSILDNGYNCFLLNHRHHGQSEGEFIGFGVLDSKDLIKWIEKINERYPDGKIILYGISMGAATVMQASNKKLTENVVGIVEDCGFTTCWDEFRFVLKKAAHLPSFPLLNMLNVFTKHILGFDCRESDSRKCIAETKLPVLFIHGDADVFVPPFMLDECFNACNSRKEKYTYSGAGHAQSYYKHKEEYEENLFRFIDSCI